MILKERMQIVDEVLKSAHTILEQYEKTASVASQALERSLIYMQLDSTKPEEVLDMFKRIHDMQMQTLGMFDKVLEKMPVEHTIQELQMLELFRNLTERQKQQFMTQLEQLILQKRVR